MTRRMSVSMTVDAVRDRTKRVTRRHVDTWKNLNPGDRLTLIEKGMGLAKGEKQVVLADVEIVRVTVETLTVRGINPLLDRRYSGGEIGRPTVAVDQAECVAEGLPGLLPHQFATFWAEGHGYRKADLGWTPIGVGFRLEAGHEAVYCRRIEWRYLGEVTS